ncbi:CUE domain family protein [Candida albicans]|uniref:CUE domain family protein n=1 Tax=Candida albicans TaxID=5476 RepID=A0A8H6BSE7_CANAX|nr:CUE domain family protein [Candida albicans]
MAKKSEELNVDTTVSTDDKESTTTSEDNKQEKTEESKPEEKKEESKPTDTTSETKPETKSEAKTEPKKDHEQDESVPPPQPPRPKDPTQEIIDDMKQAFPNIEEKYIIATLIASQGNPDPAFNALLYISDPTFKPEIPKPKGIDDDELLARKLQKEFELEDERNRRNRRRSSQSTLNGWVSNIAKRFEGNNDGNNPQQRRNDNPKLFGALGGSSFNDNKRKTNRFDEDPEILSTDFHDRIRLQDNDDHGPSLPNRPKDPDAFLVTDSEDDGEDVATTDATKNTTISSTKK